MDLIERLAVYARIELIKTGMAIEDFFVSFDAPAHEKMDASSAYASHLEFLAQAEGRWSGQYQALAELYSALGKGRKATDALCKSIRYDCLSRSHEEDARNRRRLEGGLSMPEEDARVF